MMFDPEYLQRLHLLGKLKMRNMDEKRVIDPAVVTVDGKICPSCNLYKKSEEYRKNARSKDGLVILCNKCRRAGKSIPANYYKSPAYLQKKELAESTPLQKIEIELAPNGLEAKLYALNAELNDLSQKLKEYSQENAELRSKLKIIEQKEILQNLEEDKNKRRELLRELG